VVLMSRVPAGQTDHNLAPKRHKTVTIGDCTPSGTAHDVSFAGGLCLRPPPRAGDARVRAHEDRANAEDGRAGEHPITPWVTTAGYKHHYEGLKKDGATTRIRPYRQCCAQRQRLEPATKRAPLGAYFRAKGRSQPVNTLSAVQARPMVGLRHTDFKGPERVEVTVTPSTCARPKPIRVRATTMDNEEP
jgi:hypothetical protein